MDDKKKIQKYKLQYIINKIEKLKEDTITNVTGEIQKRQMILQVYDHSTNNVHKMVKNNVQKMLKYIK